MRWIALSALTRTWTRLTRVFAPAEKLDLSYLFSQAKPNAPLHERLEWMENLAYWVTYQGSAGSSPSVRVRFLLQVLGRNPEWKAQSAQLIVRTLLELNPVSLYAHTGVPTQSGFFKEASSLFLRSLLPQASREKELSELLPRLFPAETDANWVESLTPEIIQEIGAWLASSGLDARPLLRGVEESCLVLVAQIAGVGMHETIRSRAPEYSVMDSPFIVLSHYNPVFLKEIETGGSPERINALREACMAEIQRGRQLVQSVYRHLEDFGVSVELVFALEKLSTMLTRLELCYEVLVARGEERGQRILRLLALLIRSGVEERSFSPLFSRNLRLLARKIVERTGQNGERYITRNRSEYFHMILAAAGGGVLTAGTAMGKFLVDKNHLPLFVEGFLYALNYSMSFLLMQILGFKLATKQPAMTAAALAGRLSPGQASGEGEFIGEVARITRSQFAAAVGNIGAVVPVVFLLDWLWRRSHGGSPFLSPETTSYVLQSLNPFLSFTLFYGALTGCLLWIAGLISGWVENASVYYGIPQALEESKILHGLLGPERTHRFVEYYKQSISGWAGAVSLGILLGATPIVGDFFGLPLDVRHVTLSAGMISYALSAMGPELITPSLVMSVFASVGIIGILNFGVSFALALFVAIRARDIDRRRFRILLWRVFKYFLGNPREFFWPTRSSSL